MIAHYALTISSTEAGAVAFLLAGLVALIVYFIVSHFREPKGEAATNR